MSEVADTVTTRPATDFGEVGIVAEVPGQERRAAVRSTRSTSTRERPARAMSDDELAWLLELENPSPPGPLPADPDANRWREHPETDQAAPDQAAPDHGHGHGHGHGAGSPNAGSPDPG